MLDYNSRHHLYVKDFVKAGYLSVEIRYQYLSANMRYNIFCDQAPSYQCHFKKVDSVHAPLALEATSCHMFFLQLKHKANRIKICTVGQSYGIV